MAVTLSDLARHAGVSLATASRALNGVPGVHAETGRRVNLAAVQLGYRTTRRAAVRNGSALVTLHFTGTGDDLTNLGEVISAFGPGTRVLVCPAPGRSD